MVSANVVAALSIAHWALYMESFKPLACSLAREWLKFLGISKNGVVVGVEYQ